MREKIYECVGGPFDGLLYPWAGTKRVSIPIAQAIPGISGTSDTDDYFPTFDYDVKRLPAPDGTWREFLVLSTWTTMQGAVWINKKSARRRQR